MLFDMKWERVPNFWDLIGVMVLILSQGVQGSRLIGALVPFAVLFPLFLCRMIGTGDIKVFMVLGYAMGWRWILSCMLYAFLLGAIFAVGFLFLRCDWHQRFAYFFTYLKTVITTGTYPPYLAPGKHPENMHFTIFIFGSVLLLIVEGGF